MKIAITPSIEKRAVWARLMVLLTVIILTAVNPLLANIYTVTTTADHPISGAGVTVNPTTGVITGGTGNGLVTIRSAVAAANQQPGTHTINIPAGTFLLTIAGTGEGLSPAAPEKGDLDVLVNNVTIQGAGINSTIIQQNSGIDRIFDVNVNFIANFNFTITNLTLKGGRESTGNGGGAMFTGSANNLGLITITNCKFQDNQSFGPVLASGLGGGGLQHQGGNLAVSGCIFDQNTASKSGGAISAFGYRNLPIAPPIVVNTITITNCTFTNNQCSGASGGGAIDVFGINLSAPDVTITGCTFNSNVSTASSGGAIVNESSNSMMVEKCTFLNNTALSGGGVYVAGGGGSTIQYCRFVGNTASSGNGNGVFVSSSTLVANNNWWGVNTNPVGPFAGSAGTGVLNLTKWLQLKHTASPSSLVVSPPGSSTLTASFLTNSANEAISTSNLTTIIGLPIVFNNAVQGSLSAAQTTIQSSGTATATYTVFATACPPTGSADAKVDNATVTATITVIDNIPPTVSCPANKTVNNDLNVCGASVILNAVASDNCPGAFVNYTVNGSPITSPHLFPVGTTTVVARAQDASGNLSVATCSFTVMVNDVQPPTIACTSNKTVNMDAGVCTYTHSGTAWDATGTDNCPTITFAYALSGATTGTGTSLNTVVFNKGITTVMWTATDGSNNTNTCSFTVTVNDNQNPTISCTGNKTVNTDAGVCTYTHGATTWDATGTDNCPILTFAYSLSGATTGTGTSLNGKIFNKGTTTVMWTATDGSNNTNTCSFTVTVNDQELPTITCPSDKTVSNDVNTCGASVTLDAIGSDNCPGASIIYKVGGSPITNPYTFPLGITTVVAQVQDASGNLSLTCSFTVTVNDTQDPSITCTGNKTLNTDAGVCTYTHSGTTWNATATDNCTTISSLTYNLTGATTGSGTSLAGQVFQKGVTTVTWTATDGSNNTNTCFFTVTVNDIQPPTIACTSNKTVNMDAAVCTYAHSGTAWDATGTDNCPTLTFAYSLSGATAGTGTSLNGVAFNKGITTVMWTATDGSNNTNTCSFTVTVNDNQNPSISCTGNQTVNTNAGLCSYTHSGTAWDATGSDNCTTISFAYSLSGATAGTGTSLNGKVFNMGTTTVMWTATDGSNNTNTCSFTVTVENASPVVSSVSVPANGNYKLGTNLDFTVIFNSAVTVTGTPFIPLTIGANTRNANYVSGSGTSSLLFRYTVAATDLDNNGIQTGSAIDLNGGSLKNSCNTNAVLTLNNVGSTTGVLVDGIAPMVTINQAGLTDPTSATTINFTVVFSEAVVGFATGDITFTGSTVGGTLTGTVTETAPNNGTTFNVAVTGMTTPDGTVVASILAGVATDAAGNTSVASTSTDNSVNWISDQPPVVVSINRQSPLAALTNATSVTFRVSFSEGVTGVDGSDFLINTTGTVTGSVNTVTPVSDVVYDVNVNSISGSGTLRLDLKNSGTGIKDKDGITFDDIAGGFTSGEAYNIDQTAPVLNNCPVTNPGFVVGSNCMAIVTWTIPTATDNVSGALTYIAHTGPNPGDNLAVGNYAVSYTFRDAAGNESTCSFTANVTDAQAPSFTTAGARNLTVTPTVLWPPDHKMKDIALDYLALDNCGAVTYTINVSSNEQQHGTSDGDKAPDWEIVNSNLVRVRAERGNGKDARVYEITVTATDASGNPITSQIATVRIAHNITAPISGSSFRIGSTVNLAGVFWDKPGNKHTAGWLIDGTTNVKATVTEPSGTKNGKVTGSYKFTTAGIYKLQMNVTDQNRVTSYCNTNEDLEAIIVIYDPNGGFTYGGGYFNSPAGALTSDATATGKAGFGYSVNYFKGATYPKGETQFEFKVGDFEYNALNYEYLSVAGYKAVFKGSGKIIGGQSGIYFNMYVIDGALDGTGIDKVRLKIYNKNSGEVYYDNEPGSDAADPTTPVGANSSIVIGGTVTSSASGREMTVNELMLPNFELKTYPNPSYSSFKLVISSTDNNAKVVVKVTDILGRFVEQREVNPNQTITLGSQYRPGIYIVQAIQGKLHRELKLNKISN